MRNRSRANDAPDYAVAAAGAKEMRLIVMVAAAAALAFLACGGDSRVGEVVSKYELQEEDCYDSNNAPAGEIPLIECSGADRVVLALLALEYSDGAAFPGRESLRSEGSRLCDEATNDESDRQFQPGAGTWPLGDRALVCVKVLGGGTSNTGNQNEPTGGTTGSNGDNGPGTGVRSVRVEGISKGDCIHPVDEDGWVLVLPCSEARMQALVIVQMPDSSWEGSEYLERAANDFCPDETEWNYRPSELEWILGARHIVCLDILGN